MQQTNWLQVLLLMASVSVTFLSEVDGTPTLREDSHLQERLEALESVVARQAQAQEILKERLTEETAKREALETLLLSTLQQGQHNVSHQLQAVSGERQDRLLVTEDSLQQQITLLHDAQVSAKEDLQELTKKVTTMEGEVSAVSLLNSRFRALEERVKIVGQEIITHQDSIHHTRRGLERQKRDLRRLGTSLTNLAEAKDELVATTNSLTTQLAELHHAYVALREEGVELREVDNRSVQLNQTVTLVQQQVTNLTDMITGLQLHKQQVVPLLLCPEPYRKVGGQCIQLLDEQFTWDEARLKCGSEGVAVGGVGDLATPSDVEAFRTYIYNLQTEVTYAWVGARREKKEEEVWQWVTGVGLGHAPGQVGVPWDLGEPDNTPEQRHLCVKVSGNVKFHDCTSTAGLSAICQLY